MKQILVVDDDPHMRAVVSDVLCDHYHITIATNGAEALDSIRSQPPDGVVLDMMMPVMDGRSFLLARRRQPHCAHIPILVVSAEPKACLDGQRLGAQACVPKPFDVDRLLTEVQRLVDSTTLPRCGATAK